MNRFIIPNILETWRDPSKKLSNKRTDGFDRAHALLEDWCAANAKVYIFMDSEEKKAKRRELRELSRKKKMDDNSNEKVSGNDNIIDNVNEEVTVNEESVTTGDTSITGKNASTYLKALLNTY